MENDYSFLLGNRKVSQVMFIGSNHWSNPGLDEVNVEFDSIFSDHRQQELSDAIAIIRQYNPTKIMVELPFRDQDAWNEKVYSKVLSGEIDLATYKHPNEQFQLGFRLAKAVGHDRIYCIDNIDPPRTYMPMDPVWEYLEKHPKEKTLLENYHEQLSQKSKETYKLTILELLKAFSSKKRIEFSHASYLLQAEFGERGNELARYGVEAVTRWYWRNLDMHFNLVQNTDFSKEERIIVIVGAGHVFFMAENVRQSPFFELIDFNEWLKSVTE